MPPGGATVLIDSTTSVAIVGEGSSVVAGFLSEQCGVAIYSSDILMADETLRLMPSAIASAGDSAYILTGILADQWLASSIGGSLPPIQIVIALAGSILMPELADCYLPMDSDEPSVWLHEDSDLLARLIGGGET